MTTVARSVDDVLTEHVRFQVECIDRMFLNVYVPQLQYPAGLVGFVHRRLGLPIASTAPLAKITNALVVRAEICLCGHKRRALLLTDMDREGARRVGDRRGTPGSTPGTNGLITASRQGDGTEDHSHPGQERSPDDIAEPMVLKVQPAEGNDHHASTHHNRQQGLHSTAPPDRDAHGDDSEQRADAGHVPGRKRMMFRTQ